MRRRGAVAGIVATMDAMDAYRIATARNIKFGELFDYLERQPWDNTVLLPLGGRFAAAISYRGYYSDLALLWQPGHPAQTVRELLGVLRPVLGAKLPGYKGGEFVMHRGVPVWVTDDSSSTSSCSLRAGPPTEERATAFDFIWVEP